MFCFSYNVRIFTISVMQVPVFHLYDYILCAYIIMYLVHCIIHHREYIDFTNTEVKQKNTNTLWLIHSEQLLLVAAHYNSSYSHSTK
jgi:hypothetical protein